MVETQLRQLQETVHMEKVNYFNTNRHNVLDGAVTAMKRKSFHPLGRLSVKFSDDEGGSEGAVDASGPTREFLRLLMRNVESASIFEGSSDCKILSRNQNGQL